MATVTTATVLKRQRVNMRCDLHIHVLPKMDDGSKSVDESIQMLEVLKSQGVNNIVATPHFYLRENGVDIFLDRRQASFERLLSKYNYDGQICLGAEVYYAEGLYKIESFEKLAMGKSNFILIELPYLKKIDKDILEDLEDMMNYTGLTIIFAHIERFYDKFTWSAKRKLLSMDAIFQINLSSFENADLSKIIFKFLKKNKFTVIGSDSHNNDTRNPECYSKGLKIIEENMGKETEEDLLRNTELIFEKIAGN